MTWASLPPSLLVLFEDMGLDPGLGQLPGGVHAAGAAADDRHFLAGGAVMASGPGIIGTARPRSCDIDAIRRPSAASSSACTGSGRRRRRPKPAAGCSAEASHRPHRSCLRGSGAAGRRWGCGPGSNRCRGLPIRGWPRRAFCGAGRRCRYGPMGLRSRPGARSRRGSPPPKALFQILLRNSAMGMGPENIRARSCGVMASASAIPRARKGSSAGRCGRFPCR